MKIVVAAIGRERDKAARTLFDRYVERLPWTVTLREMEAKRATSGPARMAEEAQLLLGAVPAGAHVIALDERGEDLSSQARDHLCGQGRYVRHLAHSDTLGEHQGLLDAAAYRRADRYTAELRDANRRA